MNQKKIFGHLKTIDSVSISRQGKKVTIPPFWATLKMYLPENVSMADFDRELYSLSPLITYCHPNYIAFSNDVPNDEFFNFQNSLYAFDHPNADINVDSAWNVETGEGFIKVAVFDTGIDTTHEDLNILGGYRYTDENSSFGTWDNDNKGHGTSVAGIIGAKRNNEIGIAGIAGGNGVDEEGVSLLGLKTLDDTGNGNASLVCLAIIDAARSVGTYYDWGADFYPIDETYFDNASGYGVHIGNHSYSMIVNPGNKLEKFVPPVDSDTISEIEWEISDCILCRESFLFSFQNGVINVVSAGNGNSQYATSRYRSTRSFPQSFDDSWTFLTGASAYDGNTILDSINASSTEFSFFSFFNENLDFIAPGSDSIVVTTKSGFTEPLGANYRKFNGTSASAPHVSGAAALLLSHYNQNCYSPSNLTIEDVEYVLEKSATDVMEPGFDEASGYGRINVKKAIDMIDYPEYQIWHPELDFVSETIEIDTININVNRPIPTLYIGPLSSSFLLEQETDYKVVRYKIRRTESFQNIIPITTEIIDVWPVLSQTNCLNKFIDTSLFSTGNPAAPFDLIIDTFRVEPNFKIVDFDVVNNLIIYEGYTYNFILEYELGFEFEVGNNVNIWYPFDVNLDTANFTSSFYIKDSTLTDLVVSPCDSLNLLYDEYLGLEELSIPNDILIYPNPSNLNNVNIKSKNILTSQINVFDLNGSIVIQKKISDGQLFNLDISMLKTGCYWIETTSLNNITNRHKMIKI